MRDLADVEHDASSKEHGPSGTHRGAEGTGIADEHKTWGGQLKFASRPG
jgi:hypothetical protein